MYFMSVDRKRIIISCIALFCVALGLIYTVVLHDGGNSRQVSLIIKGIGAVCTFLFFLTRISSKSKKPAGATETIQSSTPAPQKAPSPNTLESTLSEGGLDSKDHHTNLEPSYHTMNDYREFETIHGNLVSYLPPNHFPFVLIEDGESGVYQRYVDMNNANNYLVFLSHNDDGLLNQEALRKIWEHKHGTLSHYHYHETGAPLLTRIASAQTETARLASYWYADNNDTVEVHYCVDMTQPHPAIAEMVNLFESFINSVAIDTLIEEEIFGKFVVSDHVILDDLMGEELALRCYRDEVSSPEFNGWTVVAHRDDQAFLSDESNYTVVTADEISEIFPALLYAFSAPYGTQLGCTYENDTQAKFYRLPDGKTLTLRDIVDPTANHISV